MERRRLFTAAQYYAENHTRSQLRWLLKSGRCVRVIRNVYAEGGDEPTPFEVSIAHMMVTGKPAWGLIAGELHRFDGIEVHTVHTERLQRRAIDPTIQVVAGYAATGPLQTLIDLAYLVDDDVWEQSLESALFKGQVDLGELEALLPSLSKMRHHGVGRMRRILAARPLGTSPTESLLETLFMQAARLVPGLGPPVRQYVLLDGERFVARIDFVWPALGIFIELDGEGHKDQPVYDASRETDIAATTGWLCGRFTWSEIRHHPKASAARLARLVEQARRRPISSV